MNPMDCKQAQNVWSRVMAAQTAALCTNAEKAPEKTARTQQAPAVSITPEQVMQAMHEELTGRQYEVLWMGEVEGMTGKEIAARLGITPSAVSRHKTRGRKRLRTLLGYNLDMPH